MTAKHIIIRALVLVMAVVMFVPALVSASRMTIRKPAYEEVLKYENQGYSVKDDIMIGELEKGKSYYFDTQLTSGIDYFFHFQGDENVKAVKLVMFDENWKVVAESAGKGPSVITLTPKWSGTFHVKATLVDCADEFDFWFILAGYK